jgi:hypothetical protein
LLRQERMPPIRMATSDGLSVDDAGAANERSAAALFAIVWGALAETLGTAAAAAIVRRAASRARTESAELVELVITREELEYRYTLPRAWSQASGLSGLRTLVAELGKLLLELTGNVVIRRLEQIPELRASGLVWRAEGTN